MSDDETVNYQSGKVKAISQVGETVERLAESSSEDVKFAYANVKMLAVVLQQLGSYHLRVKQDQQASKLPLKESTYMIKAIDECIKIVKHLHNTTEVSALKFEGAAHALKETVNSIKRIYDDELKKKDSFFQYSSQDEKDPLMRPNGYPPEKKQTVTKKKTVKKK